MIRRNKKYDSIFKEKVVLQSYEKQNLKEFAIELGIRPCNLSRWRQLYEEFGSTAFQTSQKIRLNPDIDKILELEKRLKESELKLEILRKGYNCFFQGKLSVYKFIQSNEKKYAIEKMCKVLEVGVNRYRRWKNNGISEKQKQIALLKDEISSIFFDSKKHKGRYKITKELNLRGYKVSDGLIGLYMKHLGLRCIKKRKFKVTTDSKHNSYIHPNILNQNFKVNEPSKVWVSDITYLRIKKRFAYLTIIMDLYDRKIIGWNISAGLSTQKTSLAAWEMAVVNRKVSNGLIFHSDRGTQYANEIFSKRLDAFNCTRSMNRKANHLDNAVAESFFNTLKRELINRKEALVTKGQMKKEIIDFIENWYNKKRIHSTLNYKTIEEFNAIKTQT